MEDRIVRLWLSGLPYSVIARRLEVPRHEVNKAIRSAIRRRGRKGVPK